MLNRGVEIVKDGFQNLRVQILQVDCHKMEHSILFGGNQILF